MGENEESVVKVVLLLLVGDNTFDEFVATNDGEV